jgi:hypothetical protein
MARQVDVFLSERWCRLAQELARAERGVAVLLCNIGREVLLG